MSAKDLIADHARALLAQPSDLDLWLALCDVLAEAGEDRAATDSYADLGDSAATIGQVALAVACARTLADRGDDKRAAKLIARIAKLHAAGARRVDPDSAATPPAPPGAPGTGTTSDPDASDDAGDGADDALLLARDAIRAARWTATPSSQKKRAPIPLISALEAAELRELCAVMRLCRREPGDVVMDVDQNAAELYWIARGEVEVSRDGKVLGPLFAGAFFGEIALVGGGKRTARVTCTGPVWLIMIPADAVEKVAAKTPRLAEILARYARSRLLANVMQLSELFAALDDDEKQALLPRFETRLVNAGDAILREGEANDTLFVVVSGSVEVTSGGEALASLGTGAVVGEMSLISRQPASANVTAATDTVVLCLGRDDFDELAVRHPSLLAEAYKLLTGRERSRHDAHVYDAETLII
ncbi:MAG TPA: cyclic nucleotide-binding domain-containing protein [Kofleriaceae bacterium]|nr:cyclic nucleotide-binding domain-containing protein [Kofleriaceae bacterium]